MFKSTTYLFIICFTLSLTSQNEQAFDSIFSQKKQDQLGFLPQIEGQKGRFAKSAGFEK